MQTAASLDSARSFQQEPRAMRSHPASSPAAIRIEYSTVRATGHHSVANPPEGLSRIASALGKATKRSVLEGVALRSNVDLRSAIRNAARKEMTVGSADNCVRLLFNLGILLRVLEYAEGKDVVLFDAELMKRWTDGERIAASPSEESLVRRANELIRCAEEQDDPRPSEVILKPDINMDSVFDALFDASGEETLKGGATVSDIVPDPLGALEKKFPNARTADLEAWVERAKFEGYLEDISKGVGESVWRIQIAHSAPTPTVSAPTTIDDAIEELRSEMREAASQLARAELEREEERRAAEAALQSEISAFEESKREQAASGLEEAEKRALADKDHREAERIEEARKAYEAEIARIRAEEKNRLQDDLRDARSDRDARIERISAEVEAHRKERSAAISTKNKQRDGEVLKPLKSKLERVEADIRRLTSIRDHTSQK